MKQVDVFLESLAFSMIQQMLAIWPLVPVFSKPSLNVWKFLVGITLKPSMQDFKHDFTIMWDSTTVLWVEHSLVLPFLGTWTKVKVKVTQSCPTLGDPMDYTDHGILQARILEWAAFSFSRGSSQSRDWTQVYGIAGRFPHCRELGWGLTFSCPNLLT